MCKKATNSIITNSKNNTKARTPYLNCGKLCTNLNSHKKFCTITPKNHNIQDGINQTQLSCIGIAKNHGAQQSLKGTTNSFDELIEKYKNYLTRIKGYKYDNYYTPKHYDNLQRLGRQISENGNDPCDLFNIPKGDVELEQACEMILVITSLI